MAMSVYIHLAKRLLTPLRCIHCPFVRQQVRLLSMRKRRPTRLTLQSTKMVGLYKKSNTKTRIRGNNGPFGGMNQTRANIRSLPKRRIDSTFPRNKSEFLGVTDGSRKPRLQGHERRYKALKMQRPLARVSYQQRSAIKDQIQETESFEDFQLLETVFKSISTQAFQGMVNIKPTPVQRIAIPALLRFNVEWQKAADTYRETFLIAAETGSGKTLAYLLPTINAIKLVESKDTETQDYEKKLKDEKLKQQNFAFFSPPLTNISHPTTGRPKAIILVPTQELVAQVGAVVKSFGHTVKFRSAMISSASTATVIRNRLFSPLGIDIVVSTPHLMASIADGHPNILSRVTHLIIDEADSLFDRSFAPLTSAIIDRATPSLKQLILCSATIPLALDGFLRSRFPDTKRLVTPNLHAIPRRVQLEVVNVDGNPYQGNKNLACADTIWSIGTASAGQEELNKESMDFKYLLVFVNEREKTVELRDYLVSKGIDAIALNRDTPDERKLEVISSFTKQGLISKTKENQSSSLSENQVNYSPINRKAFNVSKKLPKVKVVVTTDLNSRGIDTVAVRNVILYDVPHSTIDFIHRLGRTGRMGRRGRGYVLLGNDDRKDVVAEIRSRMFLGRSLI